MDFSHDSTSRLSAMDELMMGSPHASPVKPQNPSRFTPAQPAETKTRSGSIQIETENLKKIDMPKPFPM
ncbi:hypothetical protein MHU86_16643 [Fragilaria crotonensis]|nr:hypothetical protein MHU86_16643 [Fragilaria crotonensis]